MATTARLDHTVINVGFEMDQAEAIFADLGFTLTERGYHSLGSINHLMMFETDYLELIGLPAGVDHDRPDLAGAPNGINGLVFKTDDVDEVHARLQALDMAGAPPKAFTRPVELPEGTFDASFRTVHVRPDVFPGGRVYFCEHGTPELVWRPEWQSHANDVRAMPEFVVVRADHRAEAERFARLLDSDVAEDGAVADVAFVGGRIRVMSPAAYGERYGALASALGTRDSIFGAIRLRVGMLDGVGKIAEGRSGVLDDGARVVIREDSFDSVLEFTV